MVNRKKERIVVNTNVSVIESIFLGNVFFAAAELYLGFADLCCANDGPGGVLLYNKPTQSFLIVQLARGRPISYSDRHELLSVLKLTVVSLRPCTIWLAEHKN